MALKAEVAVVSAPVLVLEGAQRALAVPVGGLAAAAGPILALVSLPFQRNFLAWDCCRQN